MGLGETPDVLKVPWWPLPCTSRYTLPGCRSHGGRPAGVALELPRQRLHTGPQAWPLPSETCRTPEPTGDSGWSLRLPTPSLSGPQRFQPRGRAPRRPAGVRLPPARPPRQLRGGAEEAGPHPARAPRPPGALRGGAADGRQPVQPPPLRGPEQRWAPSLSPSPSCHRQRSGCLGSKGLWARRPPHVWGPWGWGRSRSLQGRPH